MGKPIKIYDLAKRLINLHGKTLDDDIGITFVGTRPGEKLSEELFNSHEHKFPTACKMINMAKSEPIDYEVINKQILILQELVQKRNERVLVDMLNKIVLRDYPVLDDYDDTKKVELDLPGLKYGGSIG